MTKSTFSIGPPHFDWKFFFVNPIESKPFFTNDLYITQKTTYFDTIKKEQEQTFILCFYRENDEYLVQVLFNDCAVYSNNSYAIYFWNKRDFQKSFCCEYPSHIIYPKVWDCAFVRGLMDCINYFAIQYLINKVLELKGAAIFELDLDKTKRDVTLVTKPLEEIEKLIKENKQFEIISVKAELYDFELKMNCPFDK